MAKTDIVYVRNEKGAIHTVTEKHFQEMKFVNQLTKIDKPKVEKDEKKK